MKLTLEKPAVETVHTSLMKECLRVRQGEDGIMLCGICTVKRGVFSSAQSWTLSGLIPHQKSENREATASGLWIKRKETKPKEARST